MEQKIQAINLTAFTSFVCDDCRHMLAAMVGDEVLSKLPRVDEQELDSSNIQSGDGHDSDHFEMGEVSEEEKGYSEQEVSGPRETMLSYGV